MQAPQSWTRLDPQLGAQQAARGRELAQRIGLPPGPVQGQHELLAEPLPQRILPDQPGELRHHLTVTAEREHRVHVLLDCAQPQLVEPEPFGIRPRPRNPGQRAALPQVQGRAQLPGRGLKLPAAPGGQPVRLGQMMVECLGVQPPRFQPQQVPGPGGGQHLPGRPVRAARFQHPAQPRDVDVDAVHGADGWILTPEPVDELAARHRLVSPHGQHAEHRPPPRAAQPQLVLAAPRPHRAEQLHPEPFPVPAHASPSPPSGTAPGPGLQPGAKTALSGAGRCSLRTASFAYGPKEDTCVSCMRVHGPGGRPDGACAG